ncbi:MAG: acetyltransferase [Bacteroidia bacterium]|nr:acetyltransferase [Bacteroidia bacterium]
MNTIWIYGAGGMGKETLWLISDIEDKKFNVLGFIDDFKREHLFEELPVRKELEKNSSCVIAIADPAIRKKISNLDNQIQFFNIIHPSSKINKSNKLGIGNIICAGVILTVNVLIGNHVIINIYSTIGHDTIVEDYVSIMAGVHVSGNVKIGEGCFIGSGAVILPNINIGKFCNIGAGAVVINDIPDYSTAVGVPAKIIKNSIK